MYFKFCKKLNFNNEIKNGIALKLIKINLSLKGTCTDGSVKTFR